MAATLASINIHEQVEAIFSRDPFDEDVILTMLVEVPFYQSAALSLESDTFCIRIFLRKDIVFQVSLDLRDPCRCLRTCGKHFLFAGR